MGAPRRRDTERIELEIARGAEPISGWIRYPDRSETAFTGWLELIEALQRAAEPQRRRYR